MSLLVLSLLAGCATARVTQGEAEPLLPQLLPPLGPPEAEAFTAPVRVRSGRSSGHSESPVPLSTSVPRHFQRESCSPSWVPAPGRSKIPSRVRPRLATPST